MLLFAASVLNTFFSFLLCFALKEMLKKSCTVLQSPCVRACVRVCVCVCTHARLFAS